MEPNYQNQNDFTLKELILHVEGFIKELLNNWKLLLLITIPFVLFFALKAYFSPIYYQAEIRFIVQGQSGGVSGLGGLLGTFGISRPGSTNPYKILEVGKSSRLVSQVVFDELQDEELVANEIITTYNLNEKWAKKQPEFVDFKFSQTVLDSMDVKGKIAFNRIFKIVVGSEENWSEALYSISFNKEEGIFSLYSKTENETISLALVSKFYEKLRYFFEEQTLEDKRRTRDLLKEKSDSLQSLIAYRSSQLARFEDQNRGLILEQRKVEKDRLTVEIQGLTVAFMEAIKNFEFADYSYRDSKPLFLEIDRPVAPLKEIVEPLIRNLLIGILLGFFVGTFFVVGRKIYRDAMSVELK